MLAKRIITGLTGMGFTVLVIHYGQWWFALTIMILALLAWYEYSLMLTNQDIYVMTELGFLSVFFLTGIAMLGNSQELIFVLFGVTIFAFLQFLLFAQTRGIQSVIYTIFGIIYIGLTFGYFIYLRNYNLSQIVPTDLGSLPIGSIYLWLALLGTWASDTFAYFIGSQWGKHKLCPQLSPGKTIEGTVGGFVGCLVTVCFMASVFHLSLFQGILMGVLVGVLAPAGDLAESALKRFAGVKDSGTLLPGHGGVLDRFDSLLFTVPAIYYFALMV